MKFSEDIEPFKNPEKKLESKSNSASVKSQGVPKKKIKLIRRTLKDSEKTSKTKGMSENSIVKKKISHDSSNEKSTCESKKSERSARNEKKVIMHFMYKYFPIAVEEAKLIHNRLQSFNSSQLASLKRSRQFSRNTEIIIYILTAFISFISDHGHIL